MQNAHMSSVPFADLNELTQLKSLKSLLIYARRYSIEEENNILEIQQIN